MKMFMTHNSTPEKRKYKTLSPKNKLDTNVHSNFIQNIQKLEISFSVNINKQRLKDRGLFTQGQTTQQ